MQPNTWKYFTPNQMQPKYVFGLRVHVLHVCVFSLKKKKKTVPIALFMGHKQVNQAYEQ